MSKRRTGNSPPARGLTLYLIRHAHAVAAADDRRRPLSGRGRKQVRTLLRWMRRTGVFRPEEIWHSALVRSRATAELLAVRSKIPPPLRPVDGLEPEDDPRLIQRRLRTGSGAVAIVGHEPHLGALATLLVTGKPKPARFVMKKCAVLALEREGADWRVRWHVAPEVIA